MKTLTINNIHYNLPENWYDITLKTFLKVRELEDHVGDMDQLDYNIEFCSILTGIPKDDLLSLNTFKIAEIIKSLSELTTSEIEVLDEPKWTYEDTTYIMDKHTNQMCLGQFIDLDTINKTGDVWSNGHKIAASFMRPAKIKKKKMFNKNTQYKIKEYNYDDLVINSELFLEKLPMPYIYTMVVFFCLFKNNLEKLTKDYLTKEQQMVKKSQLETH